MKVVKIELVMPRSTWEEFQYEVEKWPILIDWETYLLERDTGSYGYFEKDGIGFVCQRCEEE